MQRSNQPKFYGRRKARPLKSGLQQIVDTLLPEMRFDSSNLKSPTWLEIGFGGGEHLAHQAKNNSGINFIGCEPFINGIASLINHIYTKNLKNIKIFDSDVRLLLPQLPEHSLDKVFLLFPDPWPKKRHYKRRFVQLETIKEIHRLLKNDGEWVIATDHADYGQWILDIFNDPKVAHLFKQSRENPSIRPSTDLWPITRYEAKAIKEGRSSIYLNYLAI